MNEEQSLHDDQITVGMTVRIQEPDAQAPFNGAAGTIVEVRSFEGTPLYVIDLYGGTYEFRAYDLYAARQ